MSSNFTFPISCFENASNSSLTEIIWTIDNPRDLDYDTVGNGHAISAILILLVVTSFPWNLLVITTIIGKKLYTQPTIMLMLNLATTNLLLALL